MLHQPLFLGWLKSAKFIRVAKRTHWLEDEDVLYAVIEIAATDNPLICEAELEYWAQEHWAYDPSQHCLAYALLEREGLAQTCLLGQTSKARIKEILVNSSKGMEPVLWKPQDQLHREQKQDDSAYSLGQWTEADAHEGEATKKVALGFDAQTVLQFHPDYPARRQHANQRFYLTASFLIAATVLMAQWGRGYLDARWSQLHANWQQLEQEKQSLHQAWAQHNANGQEEQEQRKAAQVLSEQLDRALSPLAQAGVVLDSLHFDGAQFQITGHTQSVQALSGAQQRLENAEFEITSAGQEGLDDHAAPVGDAQDPVAAQADTGSPLPISAQNTKPYRFTLTWRP